MCNSPSLDIVNIKAYVNFWGQDMGSDCISSKSLLIFLLCVEIHQFALKILSGDKSLTSIKGHTSYKFAAIDM